MDQSQAPGPQRLPKLRLPYLLEPRLPAVQFLSPAQEQQFQERPQVLEAARPRVWAHARQRDRDGLVPVGRAGLFRVPRWQFPPAPPSLLFVPVFAARLLRATRWWRAPAVRW